MSDSAERLKLTYDERIALIELGGAVVIPTHIHDDLKGRQMLIEACDEMNIATYRDQLDDEQYEAVLGWLEMRPDTAELLEVTVDEEAEEALEEAVFTTRPPVERAN